MEKILRQVRSPLNVATLLIFFAFFFISFLQRHVYNYDFWWHLATGKYIVETSSLPSDDPFSYTSDNAPPENKAVTLKGYWLAQVIFYETYRLFDLKGIIVLRALLLLLFLFFAYRIIRMQGLSVLPSLGLLCVVFTLSTDYMGERPQLFTFLFFGVIIYLLEDFRLHKTRKIALIPFLTLVLANMHPGYVICILPVSVYLFGEGLRFFLKKSVTRGAVLQLFAVWVATLVLSSMNPNGVRVLYLMFSSEFFTKGTSHIVEFMPPFETYMKKFRPVNFAYIILLVASVGTLRYFRKISITPLILIGISTVMSLTATRYIIFYACAALPAIALVLVNGGEEKILSRLRAFLVSHQDAANVLALLLGAFFLLSAIRPFARYQFGADTSYAAPAHAADFLAPLDLKGNMFNGYSFGGYLMWRLYPGKRIFIDGRGLNPGVQEEYDLVTSGSSNPGRSWEDILRKYDISYIVMPPLAARGEMFPIIEKLLDSNDWLLIYRDQLALIFLRNSEQNRPVIRQFSMNKSEALNTIIVQASARATKNRTNPYYLITLGKVFSRMGKVEDAEKAFSMAYQRDPTNPLLADWLTKSREKKRQE